MNLSDAIGFFPQMVLAGFCVIALILIIISRELDNIRLGQVSHVPRVRRTPAPTVLQPQPPFASTTIPGSTEIPENDIYGLCSRCVLAAIADQRLRHG